jgi:hypothetical protein
VAAIDQFICEVWQQLISLSAKNVTYTKLVQGFKNRSCNAFKVRTESIRTASVIPVKKSFVIQLPLLQYNFIWNSSYWNIFSSEMERRKKTTFKYKKETNN